MHHSQGKWYPGEPLPRWALNCYWRGRQTGLAQSGTAGRSIPAGSANDASAKRFIDRLARRLGISACHAQAGYETAGTICGKRVLPDNVDVFDSKLKSKA